MQNKKNRKSKRLYAVIFSLIAVIVLCITFLLGTFYNIRKTKDSVIAEKSQARYHIVVLGNYGNELFLKQVYEGAKKQCEQYNAVVEFYVPSSRAENVSFEKLFDYAGFVNADGVIAYIDDPDIKCNLSRKIDGSEIPLVTTGVYVPSLNQISYIGNNWWELGKKIGKEVIKFLEGGGNLYVISGESSSNYGNLISSLFESLNAHSEIKVSMIDSISDDIIFDSNKNEKNLVLCLTEESTISTAQLTKELKPDNNKNYSIIGFGSNETCIYYLENKIITELISLDQEKIGETAINQIFEYSNNGYANSYIAADLKFKGAE